MAHSLADWDLNVASPITIIIILMTRFRPEWPNSQNYTCNAMQCRMFMFRLLWSRV